MQYPDHIAVRLFDVDTDEWVAEFVGTAIPIPDVGEEVRIGLEHFEGATMDDLDETARDVSPSKYRVEERTFAYTRRDLDVELDTLQTRQVITDVRLQVTPITEDEGED